MLKALQKTLASSLVVGLAVLANADLLQNTTKLSTFTSNGNVATASLVDTPSSSLKPARIVVRTPDGAVVWAKNYGSISGTSYTPVQIQSDGAGNVCVAGYKDNPSNSDGRSIYFQKYSSTGAILQSKTWSTSGGTAYRVGGFSIDASDATAYVAGSFVTSGRRKGVVLKITPSGDGTQTSYTYSGYTSGDLTLDAIAVDPYNSKVYLSGVLHNPDVTGVDSTFFARHNNTLSSGPVYQTVSPIGSRAVNTGLAVYPGLTPYASFVYRVQVRTPGSLLDSYTVVRRYDDRNGAQEFSSTIEPASGGNDASGGIMLDGGYNALAVAGVVKQYNISTGGTICSYGLIRLDLVTGAVLSAQSSYVGDDVDLQVASFAQDPNARFLFAGSYYSGAYGCRISSIPFWSLSGAYIGAHTYLSGYGDTVAASVLPYYGASSADPMFYVGGKALYNGTYYPFQLKSASSGWPTTPSGWIWIQTGTTP